MAGIVTAVDHVGYVVTDLATAVPFFTDVLGFTDIGRRGDLFDDAGDAMTRRFGLHPRARGRYVYLQVGGSNVELIEWTSPDRSDDQPKNSDQGGRHLALAVPDMDAAVETVSAQPGVSVREPNEIGFRYVSTPFGLEIQLIPPR